MPEEAVAEPVLVVDDEPDMTRLLEFNLIEHGFAPVTATTAAAGLSVATRLKPSVIILDVMLPDMTGIEACKRLRADAELADVGILMLTARGSDADRILGFEAGADDYVLKPFHVLEVVLRVRALSRRCGERRQARREAQGTERLRWRELAIDPRSHRVFVGEQEIALRPMEFRLLAIFIENPRRVLSREQLLELVWEITAEVNTRTVDTHVRRLRQRLGEAGEIIETVHGFGYRLRDA